MGDATHAPKVFGCSLPTRPALPLRFISLFLVSVSPGLFCSSLFFLLSISSLESICKEKLPFLPTYPFLYSMVISVNSRASVCSVRLQPSAAPARAPGPVQRQGEGLTGHMIGRRPGSFLKGPTSCPFKGPEPVTWLRPGDGLIDDRSIDRLRNYDSVFMIHEGTRRGPSGPGPHRLPSLSPAARREVGLTAPGVSPSRETCVFWPQLLGVAVTQRAPVLGNVAQSQAGLPGEGCLCLRNPQMSRSGPSCLG
uniref:Uncharacterized protein n=1 Tax=Myotis myotis TaxID=51298 RepID=A0A7J7SBZ2_MYOMY|nr:hypothetical protein mMyoMyo1_009546 [Myotis myotis]